MNIVYRIRHDNDNYQYFLINDPNRLSDFDTACVSKKSTWNPPSIYIYEPFLVKGDFYNLDSDYLITNSIATEKLKGYFELNGEILPLSYDNEDYFFINIYRCVDSLDRDKTKFRSSGLPEQYVFDVNRLPYPGLFKIPQTYTGELLLLVNTDAPESDNFKLTVEKNNLGGLLFHEIWRSENE
jgi:hypothetical protein